MPPVRVLLVGADPLARAGLAALLARRDDVAVAGEAAPDALEPVAAASGADAILWDLGHAGEDAGPDRLAHAAALAPVVALAEGEAAGADALRAGARGLLFRGAPADAMAAALVAAARGLAVLDGALGEGWLRPPELGPAEGLTAREREVLALLAEGLANKAIAARLGISDHTAKFHVNAILAKLGAGSRAEAVVRAIRLGLVAL